MGLLGKIFGEKNCGICGKELGLFGKTKLGDGNYLCKECVAELSPFFSGYGRATLADIEGQLYYRKENKAAVEAFNVTTELGEGTRILLDEGARKFCVTSAGNWREANPDIIDFDQATAVIWNVDETQTEIMHELPDGTKESFEPKLYDTDYDIVLSIHVNHPYFDNIRIKMNKSHIEDIASEEFRAAEDAANAICLALTGKAQLRVSDTPEARAKHLEEIRAEGFVKKAAFDDREAALNAKREEANSPKTALQSAVRQVEKAADDAAVKAAGKRQMSGMPGAGYRPTQHGPGPRKS